MNYSTFIPIAIIVLGLLDWWISRPIPVETMPILRIEPEKVYEQSMSGNIVDLMKMSDLTINLGGRSMKMKAIADSVDVQLSPSTGYDPQQTEVVVRYRSCSEVKTGETGDSGHEAIPTSCP